MDSTDLGSSFIILAVLTGLFLGGVWVGQQSGHKIEKEAFERGHMVQCPGVTGYHWECE